MPTPVVISLPIIALFGILGYRDGVIKRLLEIVGVIACLLLTARFAEQVTPWLSEQTDLSEGTALVIAWAGLFFAGLLLSRLLAVMISKLIRPTLLGWLDRAGGTVVGLAMGTLVTSVIMLAASHVPGGGFIQQAYDESFYGRFVYYAAPNLYEQVRKLGGGRVENLWDDALDRVSDAAGDVKERAAEAAADAADKAKDQIKETAAEAVEEVGHQAAERVRDAGS